MHGKPNRYRPCLQQKFDSTLMSPLLPFQYFQDPQSTTGHGGHCLPPDSQNGWKWQSAGCSLLRIGYFYSAALRPQSPLASV